jgi:glycerol-3-phosphate acyltransferase PlsY
MRILLLAIGYLAGSIPTGLLLARQRGIDVRRAGSGNIGATNVLRTAGLTLGVLTLLGDVLKAALPTLLAARIAPADAGLVGLAAFLGHLFPPWLGFNGGKGVASALGVLLVLDPLAAGVGVVIFVAVVVATGYVSLASMAGALAAGILTWATGMPTWPAVATMAALILVRHGANLRRLVNGQESRVRRPFRWQRP